MNWSRIEEAFTTIRTCQHLAPATVRGWRPAATFTQGTQNHQFQKDGQGDRMTLSLNNWENTYSNSMRNRYANWWRKLKFGVDMFLLMTAGLRHHATVTNHVNTRLGSDSPNCRVFAPCTVRQRSSEEQDLWYLNSESVWMKCYSTSSL